MAGWTHGQFLPSFCFTYFYTVPAREGLSDCVNLIPLFLYSQRLLLNPIGNIISRLKSFARFLFLYAFIKESGNLSRVNECCYRWKSVPFPSE
ncbi:unnamed protein product [Albugo candida]|uniref:Uncharacterized protein n=1 Tax=Albugo candida TaxID=65357 RepID=A0A024GGC3_9STRA|nr:unnamed protein product [Albugo candida]|eukprot:CCI45892.1 unnamed protein product [Albugo candida]